MDNEKQVNAEYWAKKTEEIFERTPKQWEHINHQFYKDAAEHREGVRMGQILKGAAKYPTPFDPFEWTPKQLLEHAIQENVDQGHYEYGLYLWIERLAKEKAELQNQAFDLQNERDELRKAWTMLNDKAQEYIKERNEANDAFLRQRERAAKLEKERDEWEKLTKEADGIIGELIKERDELAAKLDNVRASRDKYKERCADYERKLNKMDHECNKNQVITWAGNPGRGEIKAIYCQVCSKVLFGSLIDPEG